MMVEKPKQKEIFPRYRDNYKIVQDMLQVIHDKEGNANKSDMMYGAFTTHRKLKKLLISLYDAGAVVMTKRSKGFPGNEHHIAYNFSLTDRGLEALKCLIQLDEILDVRSYKRQ